MELCDSQALQSQTIDAERALSPGNVIRDQWMANLIKKRAAAAEGTGAPIGNGNPSALELQSNNRAHGNHRSSVAKKSSRSRSSTSRATKNRDAAQLACGKRLLSHHTHQYSFHDLAAMSSGLIVDSHIAMTGSETLAYGQPNMQFSGVDYFGLESPTFSQLMSSSLYGEESLAFTETSRTERRSKRQTRSGSKKRSTHSLEVEVDPPKPCTPRRKLNHKSASFDDFDLDYSITSEFAGVGTPSHFRPDAFMTTRHLWGQDIDFTAGEMYADTFLDLPTPRLPQGLTSNQSTNNIGGSSPLSGDNPMEQYEHPRLIRSDSIEQEGLRYCLEQTNLDGEFRDAEMYQLVTSPVHSARKPVVTDGSFFPGSVTPRSAAAAVDECFGRSNATTTLPLPSPSRLSSTACSQVGRMNSRDSKHAPEFEALADEYKLTDIDHELDSFYLDTIESIGIDVSRMSN